MPVDLSLFRPCDEGGDVEEIWKWQEARLKGEDVATRQTTRDLLNNIEKWDLRRRSLERQLNHSRSDLKSYQRLLAPNQSLGDDAQEQTKDDVKLQIKELKSTVIPNLEKQVNEIICLIEESLSKVANFVDLSMQYDQQIEQKATDTSSKVHSKHGVDHDQSMVINPLFCLGGYEDVILNDDTTGTPTNTIVLSGIGASLPHALSSYSISFLNSNGRDVVRTEFSLNYQHIHFKVPVSVSENIVHNILGCRIQGSRKLCTVCSNGAPATLRNSDVTNSGESPQSNMSFIDAPNLVTFCMLHSKKTYWERQLPLCFVNAGIATSERSKATIDEREIERSKCFSKFGIKVKSLWKTSPFQEIELFALTACSLRDSRMVQTIMVQQVVKFHHSLLVDSGAYANFTMLKSRDDLIRSRSISSADLSPNEASRIVIEGYMPSTQSFVILGFVSNFTDYMTRACKTKCGGMGAEYCHTVHGLLCNIPETIEWMLQNNTIVMKNDGISRNKSNKMDDTELGAGFSIGLSKFLHQYDHLVQNKQLYQQQKQLGDTNNHTASAIPYLFIPFKRRLQFKKKNKGKVIAEELNSVCHPRLIFKGIPRSPPDHQITSHRKQMDLSGSVEEPSADVAESSGVKKSLPIRPFASDRFPNRQEIEYEAFCNQYSFLPIGLQ